MQGTHSNLAHTFLTQMKTKQVEESRVLLRILKDKEELFRSEALGG